MNRVQYTKKGHPKGCPPTTKQRSPVVRLFGQSIHPRKDEDREDQIHDVDRPTIQRHRLFSDHHLLNGDLCDQSDRVGQTCGTDLDRVVDALDLNYDAVSLYLLRDRVANDQRVNDVAFLAYNRCVDLYDRVRKYVRIFGNRTL